MEPLSSISAALNSSPPLPRLLVGVRWILISPRARTQTAPSHRRGKLIYKQQRPLAHLTVICTQRILTLLSNSEKKKNNQTHKVPGRFSRQHLFKILRRCKTFTADLDISHVNVSIKFLLMWISIKDQLFNGSSPPHSSPPHRRKKLFDIWTFKQQNRSVHSRCVQILFLCMRHLRGSRSARAVCVLMENWREEN